MDPSARRTLPSFSLATAFLVALAATPCAAQTLPPPPPPPPSFDTTQRALSQAYQSIQRANAANLASSSATVQANFLYAEALARYRAGDRANAVYDAALAAGMAGAALAGRTVILPLQLPLAGSVPLGYLTAPRAPIAPVVLPSRVLRARNEIERVQQLTGDPLAAATAKYRAALDRYFSGDVAGAEADADAAYLLTEAALKAHNTR